MGLDITWHRGLTKANGNEAFDDHGDLREDDGWFQLWINDEFQGRADDIEHRAAYRCEESGGFRAGSYRGYNLWRDELAMLAGFPKSQRETSAHAASAWEATEGPFWELINFSDCEGVIGAAVSAKLARDFAEHQAKADQHTDDYFRQKYAEWRHAFEKASDRGCVYFH